MKKTSLLIYIMCTFSFFLLAGCREGLNTNLAEANPRVIEHAMGKTEVPLNPSRVITLTNEATEAMLILDLQPIGAVKSWNGHPWWYSYLENQMSGVMEVGLESDIDIDKISALNPDLIIGTKKMHLDQYESLSRIAPTIFTETISGEIRGNFNLYSEAVNRSQVGSQIVTTYNNRMNTIGNLAETEGFSNKKLALIGFLPDATYLFLPSSFAGNIVEELGLELITYNSQSNNQEMVQITKDDFINIAKEINILLHFSYDDQSFAREQDWLNDPMVTNLTGTTIEKFIEVSPEIYYSSNGILAANLIVDQMEYNLRNFK